MNCIRSFLLLAFLSVPGRVQAWTELPTVRDKIPGSDPLQAAWRVTVYTDRGDMFPQYRFQSEADKPLERELQSPEDPTRVRPFITQSQAEPGVMPVEHMGTPVTDPSRIRLTADPYLEPRLIDPRTSKPGGTESVPVSPVPAEENAQSLPVYLHRQKAPRATWDEILTTHIHPDQYQLEGPPLSKVHYVVIKTAAERETRTRQALPEAPSATFHSNAGNRDASEEASSAIQLLESEPDEEERLVIPLPGFNPLEAEEKRKVYRDVDFQPGAVPDSLRPLL